MHFTCKYSSQTLTREYVLVTAKLDPPQILSCSWHCWYRVWPRPDQTGSQTWSTGVWQENMAHEEQTAHEETSNREREKQLSTGSYFKASPLPSFLHPIPPPPHSQMHVDYTRFRTTGNSNLYCKYLGNTAFILTKEMLRLHSRRI